ncbi:hypothetical protein A2422_02405 [Candidatus Woesebacteria bacterium RIFOXYC1_FULL_31_51]|uniref:Glycosyl transferase, group 2 family protein n=1 Tax=Candidatus Woesebacteria bacterium GW2011_GWC2_31_9 TaxID=1618586 RepID=A0A0G0AWZ7_9BACT|nr:MAG: glycosyl transferase, group 2 family protein [Candidatus Woesebacteria bacterium GW2011_GWF1_31_35]KKP23517.1 MAG: Glycosyl transferase, group 2 family protein [Candidatus Woesebacteria bacterium GW2011_GWC1_30_29]KKP25695.1 MAG: Glycosyl transferase, group 2 family protein [Candidatus Woesebacteria bacterium GW2011_GWD1_31_12]KKP27793.1 MAG: Glycosyl transferase, group 2 family protein [Candidatus Woesebacteria bacterium GW2011_GWB1_31_29]KKP31115.1 MAG: Glycosyl transferase, group 2 f
MQESKNSVTVIIPTYGRYDLLIETLTSVYSQKGKFKIKIIIIDDNYPEPVKKVISGLFPQVQIIRNKKNLKSGPSRNQALKYLDSEYVAFLDSDDVWDPNFLEKSVNKLKITQSDVTVALSKPIFAKCLSKSFKLKVYLLSLIRDVFQMIFIYLNCGKMPKGGFYLCQLSHMLFKANKIKGLKFDSNYNHGGEDWKYVLEVIDRVQNIIIVPERLVKYRYHKKNVSLNSENLLKKWNSYKQLYRELDKRNINGIMRFLFEIYVSTFQ